jgi:hypothetical protein
MMEKSLVPTRDSYQIWTQGHVMSLTWGPGFMPHGTFAEVLDHMVGWFIIQIQIMHFPP